MATAQPKSVFDSILEWSSGRPAWQRDALRRIIAKGKLSDHDKAELVQLCLKGQGAEGITLEAAPLVAAHVPAAVTAGSAITLTSIGQVSGVNRLAIGQTLPFAPSGITVVYGDNGVGKSGYARILKRACRARFVGELLANAFNPTAAGVASATIAYSEGATPAWRRKVAERLAEEAAVRQIVVFTHDLVFLNDLQTLARQRSVPIKEISLTQTAAGAGVVHEGLPWAGQKIPERLDNLEKDARAARLLYDAHDDEGYAAAVANFYNRLRSTWERALEDRAFCNVVNRHRDYIDAKNLKRVTVLTETDTAAWAAGFKICCDVTDAHDPSRGRNASPPPPGDLLKHVGELKDWAENLRVRQAAIT